jgi:tetratricopeptide (TPR) repeat protein
MLPTVRSRVLRPSPAFWIFLLAFTVRLLVLVRFSHTASFLPESDDMAFYNSWALRITHGQFTDGKAFYGLPGYAWCLAGIYSLTGGFDPFLVGVLQSLMDAAVAMLIYLIARTVFAPDQRDDGSRLSAARPHFIGIAGALAWVFFVPAQTFSVILMPTIWLILAFHLCLYLMVRIERSSWWRPWLFLGLGCGMIAMLVATLLFLIPLMLVAIAMTVDRDRPLRIRLPRMGLATAALIGGIYLGAAPAWIHNYFIAKEPVMLSAHSGINFWIGNNPTANGYPKMPPGIRATQEGLLKDSITMAEAQAGRRLTRAEVSKFWSQAANAYIAAEPVAWMRLMGTKFANFWNAYQYDDLSIMNLLSEDGIVPPGLRFGFIAALGLAGFLPALWRFPKARWVGAAVLLHMAAVLTVFVTERYRLAAVPGLIILGAAGLWQCWIALVQNRWGAVALYTATAVCAGWFVSIPRTELGLWSLDHYKAGIRATELGQLDRAQRRLETAYAYVPDNADINFALGNVWLARADEATDEAGRKRCRGGAKTYYRQALELNPSHASTLNNLGVLAFAEKRFDLAEKFLASSVRAEPEGAKTHFLLARVRFAAGKRSEARAALDEALRLRPTQKEFLILRDELDAPEKPPVSSASALSLRSPTASTP